MGITITNPAGGGGGTSYNFNSPLTLSGVEVNISNIPASAISTVPAKHEISLLGDVSNTLALDLDGNSVQKCNVITSGLTISVTNQAADTSKGLNAFITASGYAVTLTFNSSWKWITTKPASLVNSGIGMLSILSTGSGDADVTAAYEVLGDGS